METTDKIKFKSLKKSKGQRLGWTSKGDEKLEWEQRLQEGVEVNSSPKKTINPKAQYFLVP